MGIVSGFILQLMAAGRCQGSREVAAGGKCVSGADAFMTWEDCRLPLVVHESVDESWLPQRLFRCFVSGRLKRAS